MTKFLIICASVLTGNLIYTLVALQLRQFPWFRKWRRGVWSKSPDSVIWHRGIITEPDDVGLMAFIRGNGWQIEDHR